MVKGFSTWAAAIVSRSLKPTLTESVWTEGDWCCLRHCARTDTQQSSAGTKLVVKGGFTHASASGLGGSVSKSHHLMYLTSDISGALLIIQHASEFTGHPCSCVLCWSSMC